MPPVYREMLENATTSPSTALDEDRTIDPRLIDDCSKQSENEQERLSHCNFGATQNILEGTSSPTSFSMASLNLDDLFGAPDGSCCNSPEVSKHGRIWNICRLQRVQFVSVAEIGQELTNEPPDPPIFVKSTQDIITFHEDLKRSIGSIKIENLNAFWTSATAYVRGMCDRISKEYSQLVYPGDWFDTIIGNHFWETYAVQPIYEVGKFGSSHMASYTTDHLAQLQSEEMTDLLKKLTGAGKALDDLRLYCITELSLTRDEILETQATREIMLLETSDSCETEDDGDLEYLSMRFRLHEFQVDVDQKWLKTQPIAQRRMRKDIRAWARLARFGCMKLPDCSMLVCKNRYALPRRQRRKAEDQVHQFKPFRRGHFGEGHYTPAGQYFEDGGHRFFEPGAEPLVLPDLDKLTQPLFQDYQSKSSRYHYQESNGSKVGYRSESSNDSHASAASASKKRRLPREEGAYACDSSGCEKTFDRQCDLSHHQRSHRPKDQLPWPCRRCDKRFGYAKDLRRHQKTHLYDYKRDSGRVPSNTRCGGA